jgi:hypothetical protein
LRSACATTQEQQYTWPLHTAAQILHGCHIVVCLPISNATALFNLCRIVSYDRLLTNLRCLGSELDLTACKYELGRVCPSGKSVAVRCASGNLIKARLVGGTSALSGKVEVLYGGHWVAVCPALTDPCGGGESAEATGAAVCQSLGFGFSKVADFGVGTLPTVVGDLNCYHPSWSASAFSLQSCSFEGSSAMRKCISYDGQKNRPLGVVCKRKWV